MKRMKLYCRRSLAALLAAGTVCCLLLSSCGKNPQEAAGTAGGATATNELLIGETATPAPETPGETSEPPAGKPDTAEPSAGTPNVTGEPTKAPTEVPTGEPTKAPTAAPTGTPTQAPTKAPTQAPTKAPTAAPTKEPTKAPAQTPVPGDPADQYENSAAYQNSTTTAVDSLGRVLTAPGDAPAEREGRYVGIFYFLWAGEHGTAGPYDNSIISQKPGALSSEAGWIAAGGGAVGAHHFWGKPMFGYYLQSDSWVMRKHVQMLTDAGVDFLVFDTTNAYTYTTSALKLMKILDEYSQLGWKVPQVAFYTNSSSGRTMTTIYNDIYKKHPEYSHLWFRWDGKPLIIGNAADTGLSAEAKDFFRIKANQWPNEARKDDGFPWMEFGRLLTKNAVYGLNGRKEVANVSVAQHSSTVTFSLTAWYGAQDRTRSYHNGKNDTSPDAYLYGYNFAEQFEWAIRQDPEIIFITGWNEWVAQRQPARQGTPIIFVDCADPNTSRDVEPMEGGYGDNYYMQMISYIRKYKGTAGYVPREQKTIDIAGGFSQWNEVKAYYRDFTNDTVKRNSRGFGSLMYRDSTGRNDFEEMKVAEDGEFLYFFVKTVKNITAPEGNNWMNLFLSTGTAGG